MGPGVELHARNIAANQAFVRAAGEADYRRLATKYLKKARDVLQEGVEGARRPGSPRKRALRGLADALKELGK